MRVKLFFSIIVIVAAPCLADTLAHLFVVVPPEFDPSSDLLQWHRDSGVS